MRHILAAGLLVWAGTAQAALRCDDLDALVAQAVMIQQVVPSEVIPPEGGGQGLCTLRAEVVRSFMGPHPVGTLIRTSIPCLAPLAPGSFQEPSPGGATLWDFEALRDAPVIELHIAPEGGPAGYGAGVVILDAPTDAPERRSACE
jgi:hypothetical protein